MLKHIKQLLSLRVLSVMVLLVCAVASGWACDKENDRCNSESGYDYTKYSNRNWVERLVNKYPKKLLRDMSFVCAHDAGTWMSSNDTYKDQYYCERELFLKGVRAFDLRLDFYEGKFYLRHGDRSLLWKDLSERYNELSVEINQHFPTAEELSKEFIYIDFSYEYSPADYEYKKASYYELIRLLAQRYGKENIIGYQRGLTIEQVQGKVILKTGDVGHLRQIKLNFEYPYYACSDLQELNKNYSDIKVPITAHIEGLNFPFDYNTFDGDAHGRLVQLGNKLRDKDKKEEDVHIERLDHEDSLFINSYNMEFFYCNGSTSLDKQHKKWQIDNLPHWLDEIKGHDKLNVTQLNSYYVNEDGLKAEGIVTFISPIIGGIWIATHDYWQDPLDICADDGDDWEDWGVNHEAYVNLLRIPRPYGIMQFDYCGTDAVDGRQTYGNKLLNLCVENNFKRMPYVKDIYIGSKDYLLSKGCDFICDDHLPKKTFTIFSDWYIGWTTTVKREESVSNIIIVKNSDKDKKPKKEIKIGGITYHLAITNEASNYYYYDLCGEWQYESDLMRPTDGDHEPLLLYYSMNNGISDSDFNVVTKINVSREELTSDNQNVAGYTCSNETYSDLEAGSLKEDIYNIGYTSELHQHTYGMKYVDENYHQEICYECSHIKNTVEHKKEYVSNGYGSHNLVCKACAKTFEENIECECTLDNGFGNCNDCQHILLDEPSKDADGTVLINNAGQLLVFSMMTTGKTDLNAKLTADIDFSGEHKDKWIPIGINEKYPYKGTFNGQGHVIKGIERAETGSLKYDGVFGVTDGAIIKNLGVTDCDFSAETAGVFIGSDNGPFTHIDNCFSNSMAHNLENGTFIRGGDFVGHVTKDSWTHINNSCFLKFGSSVGVYATRSGTCDLENVYTPYKIEGVNTIQLPKKQYASGELCAMLNYNVQQHNKTWGETDWCPWSQTLPEETLPSFDSNNKGMTHHRTMSGEWGTIVLPFGVDSDDEKVFYSAKEVDMTEGKIILKRETGCLPNTPSYFMRLGGSQNVTFVSNGDFELRTNNLTSTIQNNTYYTLRGTYQDAEIECVTGGGAYYISGNKVWRADKRTSVPAYRAWFTYHTSNAAPVLNVFVDDDNGETTFIGTLENGEFKNVDGKFLENGRIVIRKNGKKYNLNGQEVK